MNHLDAIIHEAQVMTCTTCKSVVPIADGESGPQTHLEEPLKLQDPINSLDPADPALAELGDWLFNPGGDEQAKIRTAREVFGRLFLPGPPHSGPDSQQREAFDGLIDSFASSEEPDL